MKQVNNKMVYLKCFVLSCSLVLYCYSCRPKKEDNTAFEQAILNYQKTNICLPFKMDAYYYEANSLYGEYISFTDAMGVFFSFGNDFDIPLSSLAFIPLNMRKNNRDSLWKEIVKKSLVYRNQPGLEKKTDFPPGIVDLLHAYRRLEYYGPLNFKNRRNYSIEVVRDCDVNIVIKFKPNINIYSKGKIYFNTESNKIDSLYLTQCDWFSRPQHVIVQGWLKAQYMHKEDKSWPVMINGGFSYNEVEFEVKFLALNEEIYFPTISLDQMYKLSAYSNNPIVNYQKEEWDENYLFLKKVLNTELYNFLDNNIIIEQFVNNAGRPYYSHELGGVKYPDTTNDVYMYVRQKYK